MAEGLLKYADCCEGAGGGFSCSYLSTGCAMIVPPYVNTVLGKVFSCSKTSAGEVNVPLRRFICDITVSLRV